MDRKIILEDGQEYLGYSFGSEKQTVCEIVFNTSMVGYQEILSDPSYTDQAVVMTYPIIGSYGMAEEDYESAAPSIGALIVREYNDEPSNFRSAATLSEVMKRWDIPGISGVDTRALTRSIRDLGSRRVLLTDASTPLEEGLRILRRTALPHDAVSRVSRKQPVFYEAQEGALHVAVIDCGAKENIIRSLRELGCRVSVVPYNTSADEIRALRPDGILISNGPGDPTDVPETVACVRSLLGSYPLFGICLGQQILALACGARTYKLKFGHRGGNHPVKELATGRIEITSQNHSYSVDPESLHGTPLRPSHINLLDGTVEGLTSDVYPVFSVQYHPEASPGPRDSCYLFDRFLSNMKEWKNAEKN